MSRPDEQSGAQWHEDLPPSWEDCMSHPPAPPRATLEVEVIQQAEATFFQLQDSGTRWLKADSSDVLSPEDYR